MRKMYEECAKIYETKHDLFTFMENNREVDFNNVNKIKESIKQYGFLNQPILVSKDFQIVDGQHRYLAWKSLDSKVRPKIKFMIETSETEIEQLCKITNVISKPWKDIDFVKFYAKSNIENNKDYQTILNVLDYCSEKKIKVTVMFVVSLLSKTDNSEMLKSVKEGNFKCKNTEDFAKGMVDKLSKFKEVLYAKELSKPVFNHKPFRMALIRALKTEGLDEKRLLQKINLTPFTRCVTTNEYLCEMEARYNKGKRSDRIKLVKEK